MHTPTLISTAFTAAALFAGAGAAPVRRGSIVDEDLGPRSGPPSRRGSTTEELSNSRRGSVADDIIASRRRSLVPEGVDLGRRSSIPSAQDITNARRRSLAPDGPADLGRRSSLVPEGADLGRRGSGASGQDIVNSRRRSVAPDAADLARRGSAPSAAPTAEDIVRARRRSSVLDPVAATAKRSALAAPQDLINARRRSVVDSVLPAARAESDELRRSSLANDIFAARKRSVIEGSQPARRSSLANGAGPADIMAARKRSVPSGVNAPERRSVSDNSEVHPFHLPNRKAFVAEPADLHTREEPPAAKILPVHLPNRKAFIHPDDSQIKIELDDIPNFKTYSFPATPAGEKRFFDPASIPNRKAFIAPVAAGESILDVPELKLETVNVPSGPVYAAEEVMSPSTIEDESVGQATSIPLTKRAAKPLAADGVVDLEKAVAHLDHISIKYEKGITAYQKRTGEPLLDSEPLTEEEIEEKEASIAKREAALDEKLARRMASIDIEADDNGDGEESSAERRKLDRRAAVNLKSYNSDLLWAGPVKIGNPPQNFVLDFDTGSADTWVPATSCTSSACSSHNKYDPSKSTTAELQKDDAFDIAYGDGSHTSGKVYTDSVTVGSVTATGQAIGVATTLSNSFADDPQDGIMGMGYESISTLKEKPFFQTVMADNAVPKSQFSFNLNSGKGSELYLGGSNPAKYQGDMEWHDVVSESYWVLEGNAYVDNKSASDDFYAIVDTGTTVVVAPPSEAEAFWAKVPNSEPYSSGYYTFPCDSTPDVSFSFGGQKWEMDADTLNLGSTAAGSDRCVGSVVGMDVGVSAWIMGDSFLKNVYTTFDLEQNAVGFAEKKKEDDTD